MLEFRREFWHPKTRDPGLSCGMVCMILRLAIPLGTVLACNGRTDGQTAYTICTSIASHSINGTCDPYHAHLGRLVSKRHGLVLVILSIKF